MTLGGSQPCRGHCHTSALLLSLSLPLLFPFYDYERTLAWTRILADDVERFIACLISHFAFSRPFLRKHSAHGLDSQHGMPISRNGLAQDDEKMVFARFLRFEAPIIIPRSITLYYTTVSFHVSSTLVPTREPSGDG